MKKYLKWWASNPLIMGVITALLLLPLSLSSGFWQFLAGGALMKAFTALVAGLVLMALVKLAIWMRVLFHTGDPNGIKKEPLAYAVLLAGLYIAFGLLTASMFG